MRILTLTTLTLALAGAGPARAADPNPNVDQQLRDLQQRVRGLEKAQKAEPEGMTPEQQQDLNRTTVKTEALEDWRDAAGLKGFKLSGYMDPTYVYNFAKERGTFQFLVPASAEGYGYDNSYFGTVSLDIQKETEGGTRFHLNLIPKRGTGDFNENSIVNEASVWIPLGGLDKKLFAGQVPDWSGYEYQSPVLNPLVTHNLLFDFTMPFFYTGAGLELVSSRLDLKLMVANYNTSIRQLGEHVPAFVFRGDYSPRGNDYWGFGFAGGAGYKSNFRAFVDSGFGTNPDTGAALDADGNPVSTKDTPFFTAEVDGWYTRGKLSLNGQVSFGTQQRAAITADPDTGKLQDAQWWGVSALAAYKLTPRLQGIARADYVYDRRNGGGLLDWVEADGANGVGPDQKGGDANRGADKYALTLGLNYAFNPNVTFKAEYRFDGATENVFGNKDALSGGSDPDYGRNNSLLATQVVFFF
jgi:opacity protein-like surface antigen